MTLLYVDPASRAFVIDRTSSSRDSTARRDITRRPFELGEDEPLELTVYVDGSLVEAFINGRGQATARTYPTSPDSNLVGFYAGGGARLRGATAWTLPRDSAIGQ